MLFNELYPLADLGSFWGRPIGSSPQAPPVYSFMECFDYPYFETLDVRFYGSMPLVKFWPGSVKKGLRGFADQVPKDLNDRVGGVWKTQQSGEQACRARVATGWGAHGMG